VGLLDRLGRIVPKGLDTHIFANSGSEVVENAIKMARAHTKKTNIICFDVRFLLSTFKRMLYVDNRIAFRTKQMLKPGHYAHKPICCLESTGICLMFLLC